MSAVKRRIWLIATVTALFVLQAPFCALACMPDSSSANPEAAATQSEMPCHGSASNTSPTSPKGIPTGSHNERERECGCEDSLSAALLSNLDFKNSNVAETPAIVSPALSSVALAPQIERSLRAQPGMADLPPPDILLLKSTYLI